jgi:hypothetical protein
MLKLYIKKLVANSFIYGTNISLLLLFNVLPKTLAIKIIYQKKQVTSITDMSLFLKKKQVNNIFNINESIYFEFLSFTNIKSAQISKAQSIVPIGNFYCKYIIQFLEKNSSLNFHLRFIQYKSYYSEYSKIALILLNTLFFNFKKFLNIFVNDFLEIILIFILQHNANLFLK